MLELTERKPHNNFGRGGFVAELLQRLETLGVSFELVGQTGRFGGELSGHEPNTRSELNRKTRI